MSKSTSGKILFVAFSMAALVMAVVGLDQWCLDLVIREFLRENVNTYVFWGATVAFVSAVALVACVYESYERAERLEYWWKSNPSTLSVLRVVLPSMSPDDWMKFYADQGLTFSPLRESTLDHFIGRNFNGRSEYEFLFCFYGTAVAEDLESLLMCEEEEEGTLRAKYCPHQWELFEKLANWCKKDRMEAYAKAKDVPA